MKTFQQTISFLQLLECFKAVVSKLCLLTTSPFYQSSSAFDCFTQWQSPEDFIGTKSSTDNEIWKLSEKKKKKLGRQENGQENNECIKTHELEEDEIQAYCIDMLFMKDKDLQMKRRMYKLVFAKHISDALVNFC